MLRMTGMIDWSKFISKDFWTKKELSYQYVHFTNSAAIVLLMLALFNNVELGRHIASVSGFVAGIIVEAKQWIGGNHKIEDMMRDLFFWLIGNAAGIAIYCI